MDDVDRSRSAITVEGIATMSDEELDDLVWQRLVQQVAGGDRELVLRLPPEQRAYYITRLLDWEVGNGGLHQFFFNESHLADLCVEGYRSLGLHRQARKMKRVLRIARRESSLREGVADWDDFAEGYAHTRLSEYDRLFMDQDAVRVAFIRAHPDRFVMPALQD